MFNEIGTETGFPAPIGRHMEQAGTACMDSAPEDADTPLLWKHGYRFETVGTIHANGNPCPVPSDYSLTRNRLFHINLSS
jgi:hypothetical protein